MKVHLAGRRAGSLRMSAVYHTASSTCKRGGRNLCDTAKE